MTIQIATTLSSAWTPGDTWTVRDPTKPDSDIDNPSQFHLLDPDHCCARFINGWALALATLLSQPRFKVSKISGGGKGLTLSGPLGTPVPKIRARPRAL